MYPLEFCEEPNFSDKIFKSLQTTVAGSPESGLIVRTCPDFPLDSTKSFNSSPQILLNKTYNNKSLQIVLALERPTCKHYKYHNYLKQQKLFQLEIVLAYFDMHLFRLPFARPSLLNVLKIQVRFKVDGPKG